MLGERLPARRRLAALSRWETHTEPSRATATPNGRLKLAARVASPSSLAARPVPANVVT